MKLNLKKLTAIITTGLLTACILTVGAITDSYITETVSVSAEDVIPEGYTPIYTFEDLNEVRNNLSGNYILMNDIDMTELTAPGGDWDMNGTGWEPIGSSYDNAFEGIFDGNGHKIIGMNIHGDVQYEYVGLFGYITSATIKNLGVIDCDIDIIGEVEYVGVIAGYTYNNNVYIYNSFTDGEINVAINNEYTSYVGGIVGYQDSSKTYDCYNASNINAQNNSDYSTHVGGIAGYNYGSIYNCYNTGSINYSSDEIISAGAINYNYNSSYISNCYYLNGTCEGQESIAGKCAGLSVAQMKSQSAFTNWDF
ncbi:MAG: hypothetical protein IJA12_06260, partial [Oscillospiraceae bacterium]|nr:hypothetical protein [Oscillospiraceae bacterium]